MPMSAGEWVCPRILKWAAVVLLAGTLALPALPALAPPPAGAQAPPAAPDFLPGEILVKFRPGTPADAIAAAHRQLGGQVTDVIPRIDVQLVRVPAGRELDRVAAYARDPNVLFAEPNGLYRAIGHGSNDSRVGEQ